MRKLDQTTPIKILFVDDEQIVRNGLSMTIDWESNGFAVVGTASNGEKALALCQREKPDIVVTDVKMPVMDGLQLTRQLMARYPGIKIILLSAYDEFKYAQKALSYGASGYILKAELDCDQLLATAMDLGEEILRLRKQQSSAEFLAARHLEHRKAQQDLLLWKLLTEPLCSETEQRLKEYESHLHPERLLLFHIWLPPGSRFPDGVVSWFHQGLANVCFLESSTEHMIALANFPFGGDNTQLPALLNSFLQMLRQKTEPGVLLLSSPVFSGFDRVYGQNQILLENACSQLFYGLEDLLVCDAVPKYAPFQEISAILQDVITGVSQDDISGVRQSVEQMFRQLAQARYDPNEIKERIYLICVILLEKARTLEGGDEEELEDIMGRFAGSLPLKQAVYRLRTLAELQQAIPDFIGEINDYLLRYLFPYSKIVNKAIEYIRFRIAEDITLNSVARAIFCNPVYLSQVFKKETGENFSRYLALSRINRAKFLLRTTGMSISQVAAAVGIANSSYFSKVFSKIVGMRPNQFRAAEQLSLPEERQQR